MARSTQRGRKNNNPEGYNQHKKSWMGTVRDNPVASAAAAGAAAAAGLFLWSKRDRISEKASEFGEKAGQWSESMRSRSSGNGSAKMAGETGTETVGQSSASSAATGKVGGSTRSTGGRSGKAQSGQNMNPSRTASETVTY
jgi:hypothetical protein